jgi:bifunctional non-homologous end joining protein LigD
MGQRLPHSGFRLLPAPVRSSAVTRLWTAKSLWLMTVEKSLFNALQHSRAKGHVHYYAFNITRASWRNVRSLPLEKRRELMRQALQKVQYPVIQSIPFEVRPAELLRAAKKLGLEGVVAKRKGSVYEPGRSSGTWLKYKILQSREFVIGGFTAGNLFDALIVGCYEAGKLKYVGKVRNGFVPHMRCAMMPVLQQLLTDECPFIDLPEKRHIWYSLTRDEIHKCEWLKPLLVAQIEFQEWTGWGSKASKLLRAAMIKMVPA